MVITYASEITFAYFCVTRVIDDVNFPPAHREYSFQWDNDTGFAKADGSPLLVSTPFKVVRHVNKLPLNKNSSEILLPTR